MNIDSHNILSMLSSAEGLSSIQQLLPGGGEESLEFSDALLQKLEQLQGLNLTDGVSESLIADSLESGNTLQEIASLIDETNTVNDFGKGLPPEHGLERVLVAVDSPVSTGNLALDDKVVDQVNKLEKIVDLESEDITALQEHKLGNEIDLETTLDALKNVLNTLDEGVQDNDALVSQLDKTIENVKAINVEAPEQSEVHDKLNQLVEVLEAFKKLDSSTDALVNKLNIEPAREEPVVLSVNEEELIASLDEIMDEVQQFEDVALSGRDLDSQIAQLTVDIEIIKESLVNKTSAPLNPQEKGPETPLVQEAIETTAEVDIDNQIATIVASLSESKIPEKGAVVSDYQNVKTGLNKEELPHKQVYVERSLNLSSTTEAESEIELSFKNTPLKSTKNEMDFLLMAKQSEGIKVPEGMETELNSERVLPKFATDIANLNRAVMTENKVEIPPMTKHFAHPEWNKEVGERVIWMHKQAIPSAELRLNPGHLGPITIKIDVTQDQATVAFTAQHAAVKEAIDAALPKLREMFSAQQLNLAEVSVSQEDSGQKQPRGFNQMGSNAGKGGQDRNETAENEQKEGSMDIVDEIEAGRAIASHGVLSLFA